MDILYSYVAKDAANNSKYQKAIQELNEWRHEQLKGLPPRRMIMKNHQLLYEYSMRKYEAIITLMDDRGYFGSKIVK